MTGVIQFPGKSAGEPTTDKPELFDVTLFCHNDKETMFFKDAISVVIMPTPTDNLLIANFLDGTTQGVSMRDVRTYMVTRAAERTTLQ